MRDRHRQIAVAHIDVHLRAADQLLADQHPVLVQHVLVTGIRRDLERVRVGKGHGAGGHDTEPEGFCRSDDGPPQGRDVLGEVDQADTGTAVGLYH